MFLCAHASGYRERATAEEGSLTERSEPKKTHVRRIFDIAASLGLARLPPLPCAPALSASRLFRVLFFFLNSGDLSDDGPDPTAARRTATPPHCRLYFFSSRAGAGAGRGRWETTDAKSRLTTRPGLARGPVRASPELPACWMLRFAVRTSVAGWCQVRSVVSDMCACVGRAKGGSHRM